MTRPQALPFERSWWIDTGRVIGGRYPGTGDAAQSMDMLGQLLDIGIRLVVNLQEATELGGGGLPFPDYVPALRRVAADRGVTVDVVRFPIRDWGVPTVERMALILEAIDGAVRRGVRVYVHCWGGHGRTGTVAGCWLVRNGQLPTAAFEAIRQARLHDPHLSAQRSPQADEQWEMVQNWLTTVKSADGVRPPN